MTSPGPSATMTPSHGLVDGQLTTISATGFDPFTAIQVLACQGSVANPPKDSTACEGVTLDSSGYTDAQGRYRNTPGDPTGDTAGYRVAALPSARFKTVSIHCGPADPCVLYVGEQFNDFARPHTFVPMVFKGTAPAGPSGGGTGTVLEGGLGLLLVVAAAAAVRRRRRRAARLRPGLDTP
jgi:MYXO-CTERM domain-containing protein